MITYQKIYSMDIDTAQRHDTEHNRYKRETKHKKLGYGYTRYSLHKNIHVHELALGADFNFNTYSHELICLVIFYFRCLVLSFPL